MADPAEPQDDPQGQVTERRYLELGSTGLRRWGGYIDEEFLPQLKGTRAVKVFREMRDNDPIAGAMVFSIDMLLRQVSWRTEPASQMWEDLSAEELLRTCMDDMSHTWEDLISEVLSMLAFGWSWHEVVYKRRMGYVRNPRFRSKYNDGMIGWRKIPIRAQETLHQWQFDEDGGVQAMEQLAPPDFKNTVIPIRKSLLFRTTLRKNSPEGRSILRNSYRPWYFKKRMEEIEGIGIERDLAGLPVAWLPADMLHPDANDADKATVESFKKMVRNVRRDEQEGLVLPQDFDEDGNELYKFELLNSGGSRQIDVDSVVQRYEQRMAMTILGDFILLGHENVGSYALSVNKTGIFRTALNSWAQAIAEVFNRHEIPRLFAANGWDLTEYPRIVPGEVDPPDLKELGQFITQVSGAGMPLFPDPDLEAFIRDISKMPERSEEAMMMEQQALMQQQMMQPQVGMGQFDEIGATGLDPNALGVSGNGHGQ